MSKQEVLQFLGRYPAIAVFGVVVLVYVIFAILNPRFVSLGSFTGILTVSAELGIMTIGEAFLMITGEFDLSVSGVYALSGAVFAMFAAFLPSPAALILALLIAVPVGFTNYFVTIHGGIPSFIATWGMQLITRGALLAATGGMAVLYRGDQVMPSILTRPISSGFRPEHFWFLFLAGIFFFVLVRTKYGNWTFATGGDFETARARGVPVKRVKAVNFILSSVMAAFAGCIAVSRFQFGNVSFGTLMELEAMASAAIGGTLLTGGYGSIIGASLGALLMGIIRTGLVMTGAPGYWYKGLIGIVLIIATTMNSRIKKFWAS